MVVQHQIDSLVFKDNKRETILLINTKVLMSPISNVVYSSKENKTSASCWHLLGHSKFFTLGKETTPSDKKAVQ